MSMLNGWLWERFEVEGGVGRTGSVAPRHISSDHHPFLAKMVVETHVAQKKRRGLIT